MCAVYAFMRRADDLADDETDSPDVDAEMRSAGSINHRDAVIGTWGGGSRLPLHLFARWRPLRAHILVPRLATRSLGAR